MGKASKVDPQSAAQSVADSYANFSARVGYGQDNLAAGGTYNIDYKSRARVELEAAYRSSWIAATVIDLPIDDMARAGVEFEGAADPDDIDKIKAEFDRLDCLRGLADTARWARLYGGAIAVVLVRGQDPSTPLDADTVGIGGFAGVLVLDRWQAMPSASELVTDYGRDFGRPAYYDVAGDAATPPMRIHHSRAIRMEGDTLPHWQRIAEQGWGQSILERLWDRLMAFDSVTHGASQLVFKAHLRTLSIEGLRDIIATGGRTMDGLLANVDMIRRFQSSEGITLLDSTDKFEVQQTSYSGLSDMMLQFAQQISGAGQIPLVRLLGQSPAGLSSTGDADIRTYYDNVASMRSTMLLGGLTRITDLLCRSVLGRPADGIVPLLPPLWDMSDTEKSTYAKTITETIMAAEASGVIDRVTALKELRQCCDKVGVWSNITDEIIAEAEASPPPLDAGELDNAQAYP